MTLDEEILAEERLGEDEELMLYNMSLRQTSQRAAGGREGTHVLLSRIENDPTYQDMIERGLLECKLYGQGGNVDTAAASLIVTQKGLRYCVLFAKEIEPRRAYDIAGVQRDFGERDEESSATTGAAAGATTGATTAATKEAVNYSDLIWGAASGGSAAKNAAVALTEEQVTHFEKLGAQRRESRLKRAREFGRGGARQEREHVSGQGVTWRYVEADGALVQIVGVNSVSKVLRIPSQVAGADVVSIAAGTFAMNDDVEEIVCPDSIESIGAGAFRQCSSLRRLVLPEGVSRFDAGWIARCPNLEELVLPGLLERIDRSVFESRGLKKLVCGRCVRDIEPGAFQGAQLEEVVVDAANPYLKLHEGALYTHDGSTLLALVAPQRALAVADGCERLAKKCCYGCEKLEEVQLPDSLVEVGPFALARTNLARFDAPAHLATIAEKAFFGCRNLTEAALNEGLVSIGESAFEGSALTALSLPASIERLGASVTRSTSIVHSGPGCTLSIAEGCDDLFLDGEGGLYRRGEDGPHLVQLVDSEMERYRVFDGAVAIDAHAFAFHGHITFVHVPASVRSIGPSAFRICKKLTCVELPDSIESIGAEAFLDTNLDQFRVPARLRELGERALVTYGAHHGSGSPSLARIDVAPGNDTFYTACGMLCRKTDAGDSVVVFSNSAARVEFPEEITSVEEYAFCNARGIEYLALNPRLATIGTNGLSTRCWIRHIHVELAEAVAGRAAFDFFFPDTPGAIRGIALGLGGASWVNVPGIMEQLDLCLVSARDYNMPGKAGNISAYAQARLILDRLDDPVMLTPHNKIMMERVLRTNIEDVCVDVALHDDRAVLDDLIVRGFVNAENLDGVIERVNTLRDAASTAYLLEAKRERFAGAAFDYDL